ncbi:MAG TPA: hypothetical protein VIR58_15385 [Acidimicrobiales bacterium]
MTLPELAVDLPEGWSHRRDVAPFALVARADPWPTRLAPNLLVAVTPADPGQSPEAYLAAQIQGVATTLVEPVLLDASADRRARTVTFLVAHATGGADLTVLQHHSHTDDGYVIAAAGTAADGDWPEVAATLYALVRSVRVAS